jgi:hypothetical protein
LDARSDHLILVDANEPAFLSSRPEEVPGKENDPQSEAPSTHRTGGVEETGGRFIARGWFLMEAASMPTHIDVPFTISHTTATELIAPPFAIGAD